MASSKAYRDFVLEQLGLLDNITHRQMMGEYLLYYDKVLFGGIYDNRLLVKITNSNKKYNMEQALPYDGAKPMFFIDNMEDRELLKNIVSDTCKDLPKKK